MKVDKKILIFLLTIFLIAVSIGGYFAFKIGGKLGEKNEGEVIMTPASPPIPQQGLLESSLTGVQDPKEGNSGEVKIEIDLNRAPLEVSWPTQYFLQSLNLYYLGQGEKSFDNRIIWLFSLPEEEKISVVNGRRETPQLLDSQRLIPPFRLGQEIPRVRLILPFPEVLFSEKRDWRYALELYFLKEGDNKLYQGIYGFTY